MDRAAYGFVACSAPDFWLPFFPASVFTLVAGAEFGPCGRRYGLFARNRRPLPPLAWFGPVAAGGRLAALSAGGERSPGGLDRRRFSGRVGDALRCLHSPAGCGRMRAVGRVADGGAARDPDGRARRASPRRPKLCEAPDRAYVDPAPAQEAAAESLDPPLGAFRGRLRTATGPVVQDPWPRELGIDGGRRR